MSLRLVVDNTAPSIAGELEARAVVDWIERETRPRVLAWRERRGPAPAELVAHPTAVAIAAALAAVLVAYLSGGFR